MPIEAPYEEWLRSVLDCFSRLGCWREPVVSPWKNDVSETGDAGVPSFLRDQWDHHRVGWRNILQETNPWPTLPQDIVELKGNKAPVDIVTSSVKMLATLSKPWIRLYLFGGWNHGILWLSIWLGIIIPTDFHSIIFQRVGPHQPDIISWKPEVTMVFPWKRDGKSEFFWFYLRVLASSRLRGDKAL